MKHRRRRTKGQERCWPNRHGSSRSRARQRPVTVRHLGLCCTGRGRLVGGARGSARICGERSVGVSWNWADAQQRSLNRGAADNRTAHRARRCCRCPGRTARRAAWPGSQSTWAACHANEPWLSRHACPPGWGLRIKSASNSATIANALNSNRPTGSEGSWVDPPMLSRTFFVVSSAKMSRASGNDRASRSSLVTTKVSPVCTPLAPIRARVDSGSYRSAHGQHEYDHHSHRAPEARHVVQ